MGYQCFAEPEVSQLHISIVKKDVVGFEIPMHDVVLVENFEGLQQLSKYLHSLRLGEPALLFEPGIEGFPVAILVDKVEVVGSLQHLYKPDDVGAGLYPGEIFNFVGGAGLQLSVLLKLLHRDGLDRELLAGGIVGGLVHSSEAAFAEHLGEGVVLDDLPPHGWIINIKNWITKGY